MPPPAEGARPAVSVVIPTFNGAPFIQRTLASVAAQTVRPSEVIVVDDGSSDETCALVEDFQARGSEGLLVRLVRLGMRSGGPARPMNVGVEAARGPLIALLDHDDVFLPRKLERQREALAACPEAALSFSNYLSVWAGRRLHRPGLEIRQEFVRRARKCGPFHLIPPRVLVELQVVAPGCIQSATNLMFDREVWKSFGPFDEDHPAIADYLFKVRVCSRSPAAYVPRVLFCKHEHGQNLFSRSERPEIFKVVYGAGLRALRTVPTAQPDDRFAETRVPHALLGWTRYAWTLRRYRVALWFAFQTVRSIRMRPLLARARRLVGR